MPRKLGTGKIRKRPGAVHKELEDALEASYLRKVPCKVCGRLDNDWPDRHGLCSDCFCGWLNSKFAMGIKLSDAMAMVIELDDPEIINKLKKERKR